MSETSDQGARRDENELETTTMGAQGGLSGGEYPGAEDVTDAMSETLTPDGEDSTFGGATAEQGPLGTMGTIDPGIAGEPDEEA